MNVWLGGGLSADVLEDGGTADATTVTIVLIIEGEVGEWKQSDSDTIATGVAEAAGVEASAVSVSVEAASIRLTIAITAANAAEATTISNALADKFSSADAAMAFFAAMGLEVTVTSIEAAPEASGGGGDNTIIYVAAGGGGAVALLLLIALWCKLKKKKDSPVSMSKGASQSV